MIKTILLTIGILALIESLILILFKKQTISLLKEITKKKDLIRKIAITELLISITLITIAFVI